MSSQRPDQEQVRPNVPRAGARSDNDAGSDRDMSASLLKRVAEAAAGLRDGRRVWFIADRGFPHALEAFHDEDEADAALARSAGSHVKVGPCLSPDDHAGRERIEWIKVKIEGREQPVEFDPEKIDALFFSRSALDKFFYPYYTALYGPEEAARMYTRYEGATIVCHYPASEPCDDGNGDPS